MSMSKNYRKVQRLSISPVNTYGERSKSYLSTLSGECRRGFPTHLTAWRGRSRGRRTRNERIERDDVNPGLMSATPTNDTPLHHGVYGEHVVFPTRGDVTACEGERGATRGGGAGLIDTGGGVGGAYRHGGGGGVSTQHFDIGVGFC